MHPRRAGIADRVGANKCTSSDGAKTCGTSTGRVQRDTCFARLDAPDVRGREGSEYLAGCRTITPFQTIVKGSASYTVPWVDVLVGVVTGVAHEDV